MSGLCVVVVGAGVMGVTAALSLSARGHRVTLCDPGPLPHPLAASTDLSKVVRIEYGDDARYTAMGERSLDGWRRWNRDLGEALFHETGVLFVRASPMAPGGFEHDSFATLRARGHAPERLVARAVADGVTLRAGASFARLATSGDRVTGVVTRDGDTLAADRVVMAVGAWTPWALPELAPSLRATGHPVFHLRPRDPSRFAAGRFPVFGAAIADTGWYGFPLHPRAGLVKVARHAAGRAMHPASHERAVTDDERAALAAFLAGTFPDLVDAEVVSTRVCLYCDTHDGHFWIDRDPDRPGLVVAAGDSGHGFKFAPVLGDLIADAVEGAPAEPRFRWRPDGRAARFEEAARSVDR